MALKKEKGERTILTVRDGKIVNSGKIRLPDGTFRVVPEAGIKRVGRKYGGKTKKAKGMARGGKMKAKGMARGGKTMMKKSKGMARGGKTMMKKSKGMARGGKMMKAKGMKRGGKAKR